MRRTTIIRFCFMLVLLTGTLAVSAQDGRLRKLDREKWKQLVDEINRKRYDRKEKPDNRLRNDPQNEYRQAEREIYGDEEDDGSAGTSGGSTYGGNGSEYSSSEYEEGEGSSMSDDEFFNDEQDPSNDPYGMGDDEGSEPDDPDNSENGSNNSDTRNGSSDRFERSETRPVITDSKTTTIETRPVGSGGGSSTWLIITLIVLLALAVVYMIFVSFKDKNKKVKAVLETDESKMENLTITKSELELALEAALASKNYREAVRIYFIAIIKEMKDQRWIKWEKKKTNYHYINEISGRSQQPDFITATRAFEIVWYGNRTLDEQEYYRLEPHFKKLLTSIH